MTKEMTDLSAAGRSPVLQSPDYLTLQTTVTLVGALQTLALLTVIIVSILKPWGKRKAVQSSEK
jgi:hypothetical protein